ncbi:MAG: carboxymuconolactone decarboxylase family protein [Plesiomonas sp.]|uniref:carboxymuconolactone decarboxylase family protein n=1 Tax=Plesiomonas sp. TaxID=2486279 RepID=UPI003EE49ADF
MRIASKPHYSFWVKPLLWLQKKHYGEILNPAKLWGRKPVLFWLVAGFFGFLDRKYSPLTAELRSLVCVRVSQLNDCAFCVDANGLKLAQRCDSEEKIKALAYWQQSLLFTQLEITVLSYVEAMTITGHRVDQPLIDALKQWFDDDALIELTALIAFQNLSAKFNTALDVPAQGFCSLPVDNTVDTNQNQTKN